MILFYKYSLFRLSDFCFPIQQIVILAKQNLCEISILESLRRPPLYYIYQKWSSSVFILCLQIFSFPNFAVSYTTAEMWRSLAVLSMFESPGRPPLYSIVYSTRQGRVKWLSYVYKYSLFQALLSLHNSRDLTKLGCVIHFWKSWNTKETFHRWW